MLLEERDKLIDTSLKIQQGSWDDGVYQRVKEIHH